MARIRILFAITSSGTGGAENLLRELVLRLNPHHFEPIVCSLRSPGIVAELIGAGGVPVHTLGMSASIRPGEMTMAPFDLARLFDRLEVDLVQSYLYRANVLATLARKISSMKPIMVTSQSSLSPVSGYLPALSARVAHRHADHVVAVSESTRDLLVESDQVDPAKITVIPNGVEPRRYVSIDRSQARESLGITSGTLVVGAAGRLTAVKGFHYLLRAVAIAQQTGIKTKTVIAGEGPERENLERLSAELGVKDNVEFLGLVQDMESLYRAVDIFVLSSLREASPLVLLESMASGCAVIATAVGGIPETLEHNVSGLLTEPGDVDGLAAGLLSLAGDPALRRRLASNAQQRIQKVFNLSTTVRAYETLYGNLISRAT